ncbi:hypothetical protein HU200_055840 [Digitaria exilis]|uniref:Uncharacterized protein n=1 Tax=Digitaria exilis TaxID=1010633 RepID=A0A835AMX5_9POAL|nr:hypothetical protein HU200_055840 [Digitaria exilis]
MARGGGGGGSPAPPRGQVYLPQWRRLYDRLLKMLREEHTLAEELSVERAHLLAELEFQRIGRREREGIFQARIQQILTDEERRRRVEKAETAVLVGAKDMESRCYQELVELADSDAEDLRSHISTLAAENSELKAKLKDVEHQTELNGNNVDQHSGKDLRQELRKLKQAYKTLSSEKDKHISSLTAEKDFVWNQFKTMEQEYIVTIKNKNMEAKQATEAAHKLQQKVDELQVEGQKKDDEIVRLRVEVTKAKENMLILEDELKQMNSLKKNKKSKSEGPIRKERSRTSVTPEMRDVKTIRTRVSDTSKKRKRVSSLPCVSIPFRHLQVYAKAHICYSHIIHASAHKGPSHIRLGTRSTNMGSQRCSIRVLQVKAAVSPVLLPPHFMVPRLKTSTPSVTRGQV